MLLTKHILWRRNHTILATPELVLSSSPSRGVRAQAKFEKRKKARILNDAGEGHRASRKGQLWHQHSFSTRARLAYDLGASGEKKKKRKTFYHQTKSIQIHQHTLLTLVAYFAPLSSNEKTDLAGSRKNSEQVFTLLHGAPQTHARPKKSRDGILWRYASLRR